MKSLEEFEQKYTASSQEAHRLADERRQNQAVIDGYRDLLAARQANNQSQPAPSPANDFFGFGSMEALQAASARDYPGTVSKMMSYNLKNNPDMLREAVAPVMQEFMRPVQEREIAARRAANAQQHFSKYPEFKEGSQYYQTTERFIAQNEKWLSQLEQTNPNLNLTEVSAKLATYDVMRQELESLKAKMGQTRAKAETVRPGTGGKAIPSGNSARSSVMAALEDMRASGKGEVSEEMLAAMQRSVESHLGHIYKPKKN